MTELGDQLKNLHTSGFRGIKEILYKKGTFKKLPFWGSIIIAFVISISTLLSSNSRTFQNLKDTCDLVLSFFPSLLGFSLGGYALVVGFTNIELIKAGTKTNKHNVYQILNAIFSLCIYLQILAILISFIITWIIKIDLFSLTTIPIGVFGYLVNCILLFFIVFTSLYSLILTPYIVTNLFTLSQLNSSFLTIQKIVEERKKNQGNSDSNS